MSQRPFDVLNNAKGKKIIAKLKAHGGKQEEATVSGILKAFDHHLNMWLEDAEVENQDSKTKYGNLLVRGDNVIIVSPE